MCFCTHLTYNALNNYWNEKAFNPYSANVENMVSCYNTSRWQMGFNSAFEGWSI